MQFAYAFYLNAIYVKIFTYMGVASQFHFNGVRKNTNPDNSGGEYYART